MSITSFVNENTLLIGRRGSSVIRLDDENSDIDYLIIAKDSADKIMSDELVYNQKTFISKFSRMSFETIEAFYNVDYLDANFVEVVNNLRLVIDENIALAKFLFWYDIWLMLKNQLKQYYKGVNDYKFASKIVLYGRLLEDENVLDYWREGKNINESLQKDYFRIRKGTINASDENFIQEIYDWRYSDEYRNKYRETFNTFFNAFEKLVLEAV